MCDSTRNDTCECLENCKCPNDCKCKEKCECLEEKPVIGQNQAVADIIKNYRLLADSIVSQLNFGYNGHHPTAGVHREMIWKSMFEQMIPDKFSIAQGVFIIDSKDNISREVDLAIFDETYTPYIFRYGELKFIPIEAVAAVIECKSGNLKGKALENWANSIVQLRTGFGAIARLYGHVDSGISEKSVNDKDAEVEKPMTQTSTRPIRILCHMAKADSAHPAFDITVRAYERQLKIYENEDFRKLSKIYELLNHHEVGNKKIIAPFPDLPDISEYVVGRKGDKIEDEVSLISLMFKLNQILMLINNPIFFPHRAYVDMFKRGLKINSNERGDESGTTE